MKILFISMPSIHVIRWIENLKETSFELYWYDILNKGRIEILTTVEQFTATSKRKIPHIKGEYWLSKKTPVLYKGIRPFLEVTENETLEKIIKKINPDVIHSFEMQSCSYPILKTMNKFSSIKWIYSCWGSDLYHYQNIKGHKRRIKNVLSRIDFLHTDCERDYKIALTLGFKGRHLGIIPGGGGYDFSIYEKYKVSLENRKTIVVKGYQHNFGRALNVIKSLEQIQEKIKELEVVVFGAHKEVAEYVKNKNLPFQVYHKDTISQTEILKIMGKSIIYIGNSISDGMPNTLLESMFMGAFPLQSNPGNVTAEIIENGLNGFLIEDPENTNAIIDLILITIENKKMLAKAFEINSKIAFEKLDYERNREKIIDLYRNIK